MKVLLGPLAVLAISMPCSPAGITPAEFERLLGILVPPAQESGWAELDWEPDLWKARQRAAKEGKPIFLWEMDGHPLGCT